MSQITVQQAIDLALSQFNSGHLHGAESISRKVLEMEPSQPDALHLLGVLAMHRRSFDQACDYLRRAVAANPNHAGYHCNLGQALAALREIDRATEEYRKAIDLKPDMVEAHNNLANLLRSRGDLPQAISEYATALRYRPNMAQLWNNLGTACQEAQRFDDALEGFRRAMSLDPSFTEACENLAALLHRIGRLEEAATAYRQLMRLKPDQPELMKSFGSTLCLTGQLRPAMDVFKRVIALQPDDARVKLNLGILTLLHGDFENGLPLYENRWKVDGHGRIDQNFNKPRWDGGDLKGRRLLLHAEQGFGDTIQFIRYLPQVVARGGRVFLACLPEMSRLLGQFDGVEKLLTQGDELPEFDVHCPLGSLPLLMGTRLDTIPTPAPYVKADPELSARWRRRIARLDGTLNVGLVWSGRATPDPKRSMRLSSLAPLSRCTGVRFFSLQKDAAAKQLQTTPLGMDVTDLSMHLTDLAETAAAIDNLDMVISIDTATAHLAGAMGKRVWTMLPFIPDWRWLLDRADSPWYPTMRLFRQPKADDWKTPVEEAAHELQAVGSLH